MSYLKNNKGMTLMSVLLVMAVGAILITGMMSISLNESRQAIYQTNSMKAYYIARAGAESMVNRLLTIDKEYWDDFTTLHSTKPTVYAGGQVEVNVLRTGKDYKVIATGEYNGRKREVKANLEYNPNTKLEYAIYTKEPMVDIQLGSLNHQIGSGGTIDFKNNSYENIFKSYKRENVILNLAISEMDLSGVESNLTKADNILLDKNGDTTTTSASSKFDEVKLEHSDTKWVIDTSAANFFKEENSDTGYIGMKYNQPSSNWMIIWLKGSDSVIKGDIEVIGDNDLMIIVEDKLTVSGSLSNTGSGKVEIHVIDSDPSEPEYDLIFTSPHMKFGNENQEDRLVIYLWDDTSMNFDVNGDFYGYIIGPDADVDLKNAQTTIYGALYSNVVAISANVNVVYPKDDPTIPIRVESIQFSYWE